MALPQILIARKAVIICYRFLQSSSPSWPVMKHGEFVSHWCKNYEKMNQDMDKLTGEKWIVWLLLSSGNCMLFPPFPVFQIHLRGPLLWLCVVSVVSNKEEILLPSWPAHSGHRKIYGVCLLHWGSIWAEPDINNTSPVHPSCLGFPFMCGQVTLFLDTNIIRFQCGMNLMWFYGFLR